MESDSQSLENRLHERISNKGELAFWLVPGAMLLDARKDDKENNVPQEFKPKMYVGASLIEAGKIAVYSGVAYSLYQLAEKLF